MKYFKYKIIATKSKLSYNKEKFDYYLVSIDKKHLLLNEIENNHLITDVYEKQYRIDSTKSLIKDNNNFFKKLKRGEIKEIEEKYNLFQEYITIDIDIRKDIERIIKSIGNNNIINDYNELVNIFFKKQYIEYIKNILKDNNIKFLYLKTSDILGIENVQIKIPLSWNNSKIYKNKGFYNKLLFLKDFLKSKNVPIDFSTLNPYQLVRIHGQKRSINVLGQTKNTRVNLMQDKNKSNMGGKMVFNIQKIIDIFKQEYKNKKLQIDTNSIFYNIIKDGFINKCIEEAHKYKLYIFKKENINNNIEDYIKNNRLKIDKKENRILQTYLNSNNIKRNYILNSNKENIKYDTFKDIFKIIKKYSLIKNLDDEQQKSLLNIKKYLISIKTLNNYLEDNNIKKIYIFISKYVNIKYDTFRKKIYRATKNIKNNIEDNKKDINNKLFIKQNVDVFEQKIKSLLFYNIVDSYIYQKNKKTKNNIKNAYNYNKKYIKLLTENYKYKTESDFIKNQLLLFNDNLYNNFIKNEYDTKNNKLKYNILKNIGKKLDTKKIINNFYKIYGGTATNIYSVVLNRYIRNEKNEVGYIIKNIEQIGLVNIKKEKNIKEYDFIKKIQFLNNIKKQEKKYTNILFRDKKYNYFQLLNYYLFIYINEKNYINNQEKLLDNNNNFNIQEINEKIELIKQNINKKDLSVEQNGKDKETSSYINYFNLFDLIHNKKNKIKDESLFAGLFFPDIGGKTLDNKNHKGGFSVNNYDNNTRIQKIYSFFKKNFIEGSRFNVLRWTLANISYLSDLGTKDITNNTIQEIKKIVEIEYKDEKIKYNNMFSYYGF